MESKIEIRLVLTPEDKLFELFSESKIRTGIKSNTDMARMGLKLGLEQLTKEVKV